MKRTFRKGANVHIFNGIPLRDSAENGYLEIVKFFVNTGLYLHFSGTNTALVLAATNGHLEMVQFLVENNGVNDHQYGVAINRSTERRYSEIVKYLIRNDPDSKRSYIYVLNHSVKIGNLEMVKFSVERRTYIHDDSDFPLRLSSKKGHLDIVKYLIDNGANVRSLYDDSLRKSIVGGHLHVVEYLVQIYVETGRYPQDNVITNELNEANKFLIICTHTDQRSLFHPEILCTIVNKKSARNI